MLGIIAGAIFGVRILIGAIMFVIICLAFMLIVGVWNAITYRRNSREHSNKG